MKTHLSEHLGVFLYETLYLIKKFFFKYTSPTPKDI